MNTRTLLQIVDTRIKGSDGNPTSRSFLFELHKALERLDSFERGCNPNQEETKPYVGLDCD